MKQSLEHEDDTLYAFVDETWAYPGMRHSYGWVDTQAERNPLDYILKGLSVRFQIFLSTT